MGFLHEVHSVSALQPCTPSWATATITQRNGSASSGPPEGLIHSSLWSKKGQKPWPSHIFMGAALTRCLRYTDGHLGAKQPCLGNKCPFSVREVAANAVLCLGGCLSLAFMAHLLSCLPAGLPCPALAQDLSRVPCILSCFQQLFSGNKIHL